MNPYLIIACLVAMLAAGVGGFKLGVDHEVASQARAEKLVQDAGQKMEDAAAQAIAKLKPKYTTIQNEVQREIVTKTVYADCRHSPDGLLLANQALNGGAAPAGDRQLPEAEPPGR